MSDTPGSRKRDRFRTAWRNLLSDRTPSRPRSSQHVINQLHGPIPGTIVDLDTISASSVTPVDLPTGSRSDHGPTSSHLASYSPDPCPPAELSDYLSSQDQIADEPPREVHPYQELWSKVLQSLKAEHREVISKYTEQEAEDITVVIESILAEAHKKKQDCEANRWPSALERSRKVLLWLDRFKSVGDSLVGSGPWMVKLPWAGFRLLLEIAVADSHQMDALLSGMDRAFGLLSRLQVYFSFFQGLPLQRTTTALLEKSLVDLSSHVLGLVAKAMCLCDKPFIARTSEALFASWDQSAFKSFDEKSHRLLSQAEYDFNNCERELANQDRLLGDQDRHANNQWRQDIREELGKVDRIHRLLIHVETRFDAVDHDLHALDHDVELSKLSVAQDATYLSHADSVELTQCLEGTRAELLGQIASWTDDGKGIIFFWLSGLAGAGKSTICRTVASTLDQKNRLGASFFFKRGGGDRASSRLFFPTIVAQLIPKVPGLKASVAKVLKERPMICGENPQEQFQRLLPLATLELAKKRNLVIVVDALDECDRPNDVGVILGLLARSSMQVFVTSRHELPIQTGFGAIHIDLHREYPLEKVTAATTGRDIRKFLVYQLAEIQKKCNLANTFSQLPHDWAKDMIETLVDISVPLFIVAATICRFAAAQNPQDALQLVLDNHKQGISLTNLDEIYVTVLEQAILGFIIDKDRKKAIQDLQRLLGPLILLADSLSALSLGELLGLSIQELEQTLKRLQSVVYFPRTLKSPIQLCHQSFRDFLVKEENNDFYIDAGVGHAQLAEKCLKRLTRPGTLCEDLCKQNNPGVRRFDVGWEQVTKFLPADVAYACRYWIWHLIQSKPALRSLKIAYEFLQEHFLHWLEALSWIGHLSIAMGYLEQLRSCIDKDWGSDALTFLDDAESFVRQNQYIIGLAPLQLYHSALYFSPLGPVTSKAILSSRRRLFSTLPKKPLSWGPEMQRLEIQDSRLGGLAYSLCKRFLGSVTFSLQATIQLRCAQTGELLHDLETQGSFDAITFSPDGKSIAAVNGHMISIWSTETGRTIRTLKGYHGPLITLEGEGYCDYAWTEGNPVFARTSDHLTLSSLDRTSRVAFSADGKTLFCASSSHERWQSETNEHIESHDSMSWVWDVRTCEMKKRLRGLMGPVSTLAYSPDGEMLAVGTTTKEVRLFDSQTGTEIQQFESNGQNIDRIALSTDGRLIAVSSALRSPSMASTHIQLWNSRASKRVLDIDLPVWSDSEIAISLDEKVLAAANSLRVYLWDTSTGDQFRILEGHDAGISAIVFSPDTNVLATASRDSTIRVWRVRSSMPSQASNIHDGEIFSMSLSSDGALVSVVDEQLIRLFDVHTGTETQQIQNKIRLDNDKGLDHHYRSMFSPDGKMIATWGSNSVMQLWNTQTGQQIQMLGGHGAGISLVTFCDGGKIIVTISSGGNVCVWLCRTGRKTRERQIGRDSRTKVAVSCNGQVAWGNDSNQAQIWRPLKDSAVLALATFEAYPRQLTFSADGELLALSLDDSPIRVYNTQTGDEVYNFEYQHAGPISAAFSLDKRILAFVSINEASPLLRLWDMHSNKECSSFPLHSNSSTLEVYRDERFLRIGFGVFQVDPNYSLRPVLLLNNDWLQYRGRDLLWLPLEYRKGSRPVIATENTIIIGQSAGNISFLQLAEDVMEVT